MKTAPTTSVPPRLNVAKIGTDKSIETPVNASAAVLGSLALPWTFLSKEAKGKALSRANAQVNRVAA